MLNIFKFAYIGLGVWDPYVGGILFLGPYILLLVFCMLSGICLCVLYVYFYVCSPVSYWIWQSHLGYGDSSLGHDCFQVQGVLQGLLLLVENIYGLDRVLIPRYMHDFAFARSF